MTSDIFCIVAGNILQNTLIIAIPLPIYEGELMYKLSFLRGWVKTISPKSSFKVFRKHFLCIARSLKGFSFGATLEVKHLCMSHFAVFAKIFISSYFGKSIAFTS